VSPLALSTPVVLIPGRNYASKFTLALRQFPYLPDLPQLVVQLNRLSRTGGVPATVDDGNTSGRPWLRLYGERCVIGVSPTSRGDAYYVQFIEPMTLKNHARLARGPLRLPPPAWQYLPTLQSMPAGLRAHYDDIRRAWLAARSRPAAEVPPLRPPSHDQLCDDLDTVIEAARQIQAAQRQELPVLPYYRVSTASTARDSAAGIYVFHLDQPGTVTVGAMVELRQVPDLKGKVHDLDLEQMTVRFDRAVDFPRIPPQGEFVVGGSDVIQRVQRDAVARLRDGAAVNPRLLPLLADAAFTPYTGPDPQILRIQPGEDLNDSQLAAFHSALSVPDLLLVLGPPGTGKTRTIVQIATAVAAHRGRVLIASQTNTAVDNVLERLPESLIALRVGNEARMSAGVRHRTLPAVVDTLRDTILDRTSSTADQLAPWRGDALVPRGWRSRLDTALQDHTAAAAESTAAAQKRLQAAEAVEARYAEPLRAAIAAQQTADEAFRSTDKRLASAARRRDRATARSRGLFGFYFRWRLRRYEAQWATATSSARTARGVLDTAEQAVVTLQADISRAVQQDAAVRRADQRLAAADAAAERTIQAARSVAAELARLLAGVIPSASAVPEDPAGLAGYRGQYVALEPVLRSRIALLDEWRAQLTDEAEQLRAELVRYADVIGTTCIGAGIERNMLSDLDFDLAVIDEAGQIPITSTLVPLVRARRAVLVGDHQQLPPFVDDDVRGWLARRASDEDGAEAERLLPLLSRSAFERLIKRASQANQLLLSEQRRMPGAIADFVSRQFYGNQLTTATKPRTLPGPFRSPLAIVDTADQTRTQRAERNRLRSETWQATGRDNLAEAKLVVDLVQRYAQAGWDWAVIAPYRAQVQLIDGRLRTMLGADAVTDRVGTVDAFQGKEKDIVIYSFTRSNAGGEVGFLAELRRLNVAITRARAQLVLIGDFSTLCQARHGEFRQLAGDLYRHAQAYGEIRRSSELRELLR
jgi:hypothetical protein